MANPYSNTGNHDWTGCTNCRLHTNRRNVVVQRQIIVNNHEVIKIQPIPPQKIGLVRSYLHINYYKILFIGEAPEEVEDFNGKPFDGISGNILYETLKLCKSTFFALLTNTVCCRPSHTPDTTSITNLWGKNRPPEESEQDLCVDHTHELLSSQMFTGVILLGEIATTYYKRHKFNHPSLNLHHPSYIARLDYKLITMREEARKIDQWLKEMPPFKGF